jgi:molybdenum cofactor cytidylyltransferase
MVTNKQGGCVAAVVLAAGMSRRMGMAKQLLGIEGKTLLERTLDNVRAARVSEIVLVLGAEAEEIQRQLPAGDFRVVVNSEYQQGMGTSLRCGLAAVSPSTQAALIVLADQPFVRPATLDRLIAYHAESQAQIVLPLHRGFRGNPVLLDRSVFPEVMSLSGDVGCRAIFGNHTDGIHKLEVDDPGVLLDIDTEADLRNIDWTAGADPVERFRLPQVEGREPQGNRTARPELVIVGRDEVARALAKLACVLKFNITFVDPLLRPAEVPEADRVLHLLNFALLPCGEKFVVVASRGQCDEEAVEEALNTGASYVALLSNKNRAREIINSLRQREVGSEKLALVRAPAGLEIGAESPEEIALSILAEIVATSRTTRKG